MTQQDFWNLFYNSASILWARFQVLFGCIVLVITMTDMSQWLPKEWMPIWLVINGVIAEYLRRSNTQTSTIEVQPQGIMSGSQRSGSKQEMASPQQVTYLQSESPVPKGATVIQGTTERVKYSGSSVFGMIGISFGLLAATLTIIFLVIR